MSAPTLSRASGAVVRSAYPVPVDAITAQLRARLAEPGAEFPSRNQIMTEFRVGAPKANKVLALLADTTPTSAPAGATDPDTDSGRVRAEHLTVSAVPVPVGPDTHAGDTVDAVTAPVATADPVTVESDDVPTDPVSARTGSADQVAAETIAAVSSQVTPVGDPVTDPVVAAGEAPPVTARVARSSRVWLPRHWPLLLLAAPAFVAIWGGWVGLGQLAGFGEIVLLPGIADSFTIDSSITLPIGVETYAAYALKVWLTNGHPPAARRFAKWSAIASLVLGMAGQVAYHLMTAAHMDTAPWQITTLVACLPVVVLGSGAALAHLTHTNDTEVTA